MWTNLRFFVKSPDPRLFSAFSLVCRNFSALFLFFFYHILKLQRKCPTNIWNKQQIKQKKKSLFYAITFSILSKLLFILSMISSKIINDHVMWLHKQQQQKNEDIFGFEFLMHTNFLFSFPFWSARRKIASCLIFSWFSLTLRPRNEILKLSYSKNSSN